MATWHHCLVLASLFSVQTFYFWTGYSPLLHGSSFTASSEKTKCNSLGHELSVLAIELL